MRDLHLKMKAERRRQDVERGQVRKSVFSLSFGYGYETETPNNFCPSKFSRVCPDFHFLQIANLGTHVYRISQVCLDLRFL